MMWVLESLASTLLTTAVGGSPPGPMGLGRYGGYTKGATVSSGHSSPNSFIPHEATSPTARAGLCPSSLPVYEP